MIISTKRKLFLSKKGIRLLRHLFAYQCKGILTNLSFISFMNDQEKLVVEKE